MKNIEIIVDVTGSCNIKEIESQLQKIKDELKGKAINTNVSFCTDEYFLNKNLQDKNLQNLDLPLKNEDINNFVGGCDDFTKTVKSKLVNNPDAIIFIGDLGHAPLAKNTFENNLDTQLVIIQTSYSNIINKNYAISFIQDIKNTIKTHISDVETYKSLDDILKYSIQDKIGKLRNSAQNQDNNSETKPKP
jgi:hypothetical protein